MHAAVHWLMECSGGGVLKTSDSTNICVTFMTVIAAMGLKHLDLCAPPDRILLARANLPLFEDSEIT